MISNLKARASVRAILLASLAMMLAGVALSQSGRRIPNKASPSPVPTTSPEPSAKPAEPAKPALPILLVFGGSAFHGDPSFNRTALESCEKRLKKSTAVTVRIGKDMNRSQASDYAKSMNQYVASLDLEQEGQMGMSRPRTGFDDIWVRYYVFESGTGKSKADGRVHLRPPKTSVGLPMPAPGSRMTIQYAVEEAGREAAERILGALGIADLPRH